MVDKMTEERTTESPQKWWASGGDIPTINEVVERLRAEGNLDEEKWKKVQYPNNTLAMLLFITFGALGVGTLILFQSKGIAILFLIIAIVLLLAKYRSISPHQYYLYNFRIVVHGEVKYIQYITIPLIISLKIIFVFKPESGHLIQNQAFLIPSFFYWGKYQKKKSIRVIYCPINPPNNGIYTNSSKKKFSLKIEEA